MKITISYFGQARTLAGLRSECLEVADHTSPGEVLGKVAGTHGEAFDRLLFGADGRLRRGILLAVGGTVRNAEDRAVLKDGDAISVQTAIAGG